MRPISLAALLLWCVGCGGGSGGGGSNANGAILNMDAHVQHNLATINNFRAQNGAKPLVLDDALTAFSQTAAQALHDGGEAHGYFKSEAASGDIWKQGFCGNAGENQTGPGWTVESDEDATIDAVLQMMMDEGPGGGHHDNIVSPDFTRLGVGRVVGSDQKYYLSNDFSGACH